MADYSWATDFERIYKKAVERYKAGERSPDKFFDAEEMEFLNAIGQTAQEIFDFAEDAVKYQEPDFSTVLLIASARRDYFWVMQKGQSSPRKRTMTEFPPKTDQVAGIEWLPRLIEKARAKLRGELPDDLMYGCGGDRRFFKEYDIPAADFLRVVWSAGEETGKVVEYVTGRAGKG